MNNKIIQSIHHEHGENILNGVKRYEIRKTAPKSNLQSTQAAKTFPSM